MTTDAARSGRLVPLVPGTLYRIGGVVPARDLTWTADSKTRWEALNSYLLTTENEAVFIDTGTRICEPQMEHAVRELVGDRSVWVFPTRNEPDCIGNLGLVLGLSEQARLLFGGGGGILEWINDPAVDEQISRGFLNRRQIVPASNGTSQEFSEEVRFHWMDAPVKEMFLTQWAYEERTRTLFTSDFFGWSHLETPDGPVVADGSDGLPGVDEIAEEIPHRFNWLPGAHCPEVLDAFEETVARHPIERIAPVHGRVISGREAVRTVVDATRSALSRLVAPSTVTHSRLTRS